MRETVSTSSKPSRSFSRIYRLTSYRLYSGIVPLQNEWTALIGYPLYLNYFRGVEREAIWATACLETSFYCLT